MQRVPPGLHAVLQRFEGWLLQRIKEPEVLERLQLEIRWKGSPSPWLEAFKRDATDQLAQEWEGVEEPVPRDLLEEIRNGFVWRHYVKDWILAQALPQTADLPLEGPGSSQGKITREDVEKTNSLEDGVC